MKNDILEIALGQFGNSGIYGAKNEEEILKYYHEIGFEWVDNDDVSWCAGFLNWCLLKAGKPFFKSLHARDFLEYGTETKEPQMGDIVILWRIAKDSQWGHAGIFIRETKNTIYILGGNQSNSVNIQPFPKTQVLGYRKIL